MTHSRPPAFSREVAVKYLRQKIGNDSGNISGNISSHISRLLYANPNDLESRQHKARTTARPLSGHSPARSPATPPRWTSSPGTPKAPIFPSSSTHRPTQIENCGKNGKKTGKPSGHISGHISARKSANPTQDAPRFRHSV
ncbi:MAG: hypothetical protein ACXVCO_06715 [Ktedonobacterales bacterium]